MTPHRSLMPPSNASSFDSGLNVLFLSAFPLVLWLFRDSAANIIVAVIGIILFAVALRLISSGQKIQNLYDAAEMAHKPRLPRKIIGSVLIGIVVAILAGSQSQSLLFPAAMGAVALGLSLTTFGLDPMKDKGLDNPEVLAKIEIAEFQAQIEEELSELAERVADLGDAQLTMQTDAARTLAVQIARSFATSASDLRQMRKPFAKFIAILGSEIARLEAAWHGDEGRFARHRYSAKLQVLADSFAERARRGGVKSGRDVFEMEADMLLGRMPQENAA